MKKIFTAIAILVSIITNAQDSIRVTITPQARDVDHILFYVYNDNSTEDLYDSIKVRYRVQNAPENTQTVSLNGYTADWVTAMQKLNVDYIAIDAGTRDRVRALLLAVNQPYLTAKINSMTAANIATAQTIRTFGRFKGRRQ